MESFHHSIPVEHSTDMIPPCMHADVQILQLATNLHTNSINYVKLVIERQNDGKCETVH